MLRRLNPWARTVKGTTSIAVQTTGGMTTAKTRSRSGRWEIKLDKGQGVSGEGRDEFIFFLLNRQAGFKFALLRPAQPKDQGTKSRVALVVDDIQITRGVNFFGVK